MKLRLTAQIITGLAIAIGTTTALNQPSPADEGATFFCGMSKGVPVTYARTARGNVPVIRWVDKQSFSPEWTPNRRCQEVSRRFQSYSDNSMLKVLKPGKLQGQPVVCAASSPEDPCTQRTLLFTLKRGSNASLIVQKLMDRQGLAAGNIVTQIGGCKDRCPLYVNMDVYLNKAKVEENISHNFR